MLREVDSTSGAGDSHGPAEVHLQADQPHDAHVHQDDTCPYRDLAIKFADAAKQHRESHEELISWAWMWAFFAFYLVAQIRKITS
jgi:hypothetical protein